MRILSCYVWLKSILFHLLCVFDPLSLNGLALPHKNAPLREFLGRRVWGLALRLLEICQACSVYWVTGPAGLCNKKLIYIPGHLPVHKCTHSGSLALLIKTKKSPVGLTKPQDRQIISVYVCKRWSNGQYTQTQNPDKTDHSCARPELPNTSGNQVDSTHKQGMEDLTRVDKSLWTRQIILVDVSKLGGDGCTGY